MRYVIWAPEAQKDLREIRGYIAADNPEAARRHVRGIRDVAMSLVDFPFKGRAIGEGLRQLTAVYPYIIRYRVHDDRIEIARVYHGARRVRAKRWAWIGPPPQAFVADLKA